MKFKVPLRIGIVQLNPQIGQTKDTTTRAWKLLDEFQAKNKGRSPDILVFPEFALTGYSFHDRNHILPYTSKVGEGPTYQFAQEVSRKFNCYTVIGYPEKTSDDSKTATLYNSAVMVNSSGDLVFNYRKSFLYYTDDDWGCQENPMGFQQFEIPVNAQDPDGTTRQIALKTGIGICMDLSNYKFEAPFTDYEFATYHLDHGTELLLCPMAWLHLAAITKDTADPQEQWSVVQSVLDKYKLPEIGSQGNFEFNLDKPTNVEPIPFEEALSVKSYDNLDKPEICNITYWILRFTPFVALKKRYEWFHSKVLVPYFAHSSNKTYIGSSLAKPWVHEGKETVLVLANRCGIEDKKTVYAGSSGIYKFNGRTHGNQDESVDTTNQSVDFLGNLSKGLEGMIVRDVTLEVERESE